MGGSDLYLPNWTGRILGAVLAASGLGVALAVDWVAGAMLIAFGLAVAFYERWSPAKRCGWCRELIRLDARACRHCGRDQTPAGSPFV